MAHLYIYVHELMGKNALVFSNFMRNHENYHAGYMSTY
jgi:hypothetical protein